jgi:protein-tyrosine phosphatase
MKAFNHVLDKIYIGSLWAFSEHDALRSAGITSVVKLTRATVSGEDGFTILDIAFPDGWHIPDGYLRRGLDFVHDNEAAGHGVLIMCAAGISRSATFTLAYLVERGYDLHDAFKHLRECRPIVSPHPALWMSLLQFFDEPYSLNDVLSW